MLQKWSGGNGGFPKIPLEQLGSRTVYFAWDAEMYGSRSVFPCLVVRGRPISKKNSRGADASMISKGLSGTSKNEMAK